MNLITKDYKMYKLQIKIEKLLIIIICIFSIYLAYKGAMFVKDTASLASYSSTDSQIKKIELDITNIDTDISNLDVEIQKIDQFLQQETPTEDELRAFHVNNIMYNILDSTNNGTKLHNVLVVGDQMEISGVSKKIEDVSAIAKRLSKYYDVDINKTQLINHNSQGAYYAFKLILTGRGNN